jgi:hypothetical protein
LPRDYPSYSHLDIFKFDNNNEYTFLEIVLSKFTISDNFIVNSVFISKLKRFIDLINIKQSKNFKEDVEFFFDFKHDGEYANINELLSQHNCTKLNKNK